MGGLRNIGTEETLVYNFKLTMMGEEKVDMEQQPPPYPYQQQPPTMGPQHQWAPVVLDQPMPPKVGKNPEVVTCLNCRAQVQTRVNRNLSQNGWIWSFVLWFVTGCCCFIPCVMDGFHDYEHKCPKCNAIMGKAMPDDRDEERKKGLKIVIGVIIGTIICSIVLVILYFVLVIGILGATYNY